ncbi:3-phosphoshikimate 1-carboxyvinyltransferase [Halococcus hamelinensis]|uniref:3-phosphoshikimate 1-carboxyvinyltransferase n=1 Tax=Halococcus hamelinensis 100A6 TaxID=1132509 RepID=M0LY83_9EURY|nr:3-phosphoshikimate 1-carboxyvinyltransferase [Halococcus hamelinensis]EMA38411.1 3-phosphoshikimate 1-carboxyvinyltransferase [Halococcus hamelinensis 100A6]
MDAEIAPSSVAGRVTAPPSKSYTHRAILAAGYGEGETRVEAPLVSADTRATARAVRAFGGGVDLDDGTFVVRGFGNPETPDDVIDCGNSGTTMRLVTGTAALADGLTVLTGDGSLRSRPHGPLLDAIEDLEGRAESTRDNGRAPLVVGGPVAGERVSIPGDVSSQFVTALLMAGARTESGLAVDLETELKSAPYVEITRELLADFGVEAERTDEGFAVAGDQSYDPGGSYRVPGDFSSASYLLAAGALAADDGLGVEGAYPTAQGDTAIVDHLERMGAALSWDRDSGTVSVERSDLRGVEVDVGDTPDLLPTLATLGAAADGETRIVNAEHVRYKETDRVSAMADELEKMGAAVTEHRDSLTVHGGDSTLRGARVDGRGDHRIVMALAVAGLVADGTTTIEGAEHVDVSFPDFFDALRGIGVDVDLD